MNPAGIGLFGSYFLRSAVFGAPAPKDHAPAADQFVSGESGQSGRAPAIGASRPDGSWPAGFLHLTEGRFPAGFSWDHNPQPFFPFPGGGLGAPIPKPTEEGAPRAQEALNDVSAPSADHPMMKQAAAVRADLIKEKLPADAAGVRVAILGENVWDPAGREHGRAIARTIAGPVGLAQKSEVLLLNQHVGTARHTMEENGARMKRSIATIKGEAGYKDAMKHAVDDLENQIYRASDEINGLAGRAVNDGKTTIATMSWGQSPFRASKDIADAAIRKGNDSPLLKDINERRIKRGEATLDLTKKEDTYKFRGDVLMGVLDEVAGTDGKARLDAARKTLGDDVAAARKKGIFVVAAAGNEHMPGAPWKNYDQSVIAGVPGIVTVGATRINDPLDPKDDKVVDFSNSGATIAAPGFELPVGDPPIQGLGPPPPKGKDGKPLPSNINGTSFSAPYVASVAALMVKANPKITPDQLEQILTSKAVLRDDPSTDRDGLGILDPVAAVRCARDLKN